jgi:hypothetical protein
MLAAGPVRRVESQVCENAGAPNSGELSTWRGPMRRRAANKSPNILPVVGVEVQS